MSKALSQIAPPIPTDKPRKYCKEFVVGTTARQPTFTLITGGNSGIGLELARQAAADGRNLILVAHNEATLEAAEAELQRNVKVHTISQDLSQPGAAETVHDRVRTLGTEVDCLINNAGFGDHGPFATSDLAKQRSMIAVNVTALTELTRLFLPAMLERGHGQILNTASVTGFVPGPRMSVYFATKHYVLAFSEALIEELRGSGVTVTALCPPPVRTPFVSEAQIASSNYMATTKITPAEVARYGYRMMRRGKPVAIYGLRWKFVMNFLVRITPRFGLRRLLGHMNVQGAPSSQPARRR
jgi:short-subunit dehydrogenase